MIGKDLEGSGHGVIEVLSLNYTGMSDKIHENPKSV
jgi:hypothetical protein